MPREKTVVVKDNTMVYDSSKGKYVKSPHIRKGERSITTDTTIKKGGKIKKQVSVSDWNVLDKGKFKDYKTADISKYNKAGELKKKVSLTSEDGVVKKTVTKANGETVTKKAGLIAKARLKKI
jgi:hypothetical protein